MKVENNKASYVTIKSEIAECIVIAEEK